MSDTEMALDYYRACFCGERPNYVPARIVLPCVVRGDFPSDLCAFPGEHEAVCNPLGAVAVKVGGKLLGVKPREFIPITWRRNEK